MKHSQSLYFLFPQEEFSFNDSMNRSTGKKTFQTVYGLHPKGPLDLVELPSNFRVHAQGEELVELITKV